MGYHLWIHVNTFQIILIQLLTVGVSYGVGVFRRRLLRVTSRVSYRQGKFCQNKGPKGDDGPKKESQRGPGSK